jgi:hypothetical protein
VFHRVARRRWNGCGELLVGAGSVGVHAGKDVLISLDGEGDVGVPEAIAHDLGRPQACRSAGWHADRRTGRHAHRSGRGTGVTAMALGHAGSRGRSRTAGSASSDMWALEGVGRHFERLVGCARNGTPTHGRVSHNDLRSLPH